MLKNIVLFTFFITFLAFSLSLKILNADVDQDAFLESNATLPIDKFTESEFTKIGQESLLNNDFVITAALKYKNCNTGSLYITPLFRNSEGVSVLKKKILKKVDALYFVYQGTIYQEFPSLRFWIGMNVQKMINIFNNKSHSVEFHYVLAVVEKGDCNLKNTLNWQDI